MTSFRLRLYGSPDWTDITLDGELEEWAGEALLSALEGAEHVHVQRRAEDGLWEDV